MIAREILAALAGPALFLLAGAGLLALLPGLAARPLPGRLGLAYLLGVAWVAGLLFALSHIAGVPLRRPTILTLALLPAAAGLLAVLLRRHRNRVPPDRQPTLPSARRRSRITSLARIAAILVGGAVTLALLADAATTPARDWDGRMTWAAQARYLRAEGTVDAAVLHQGKWFVSHPRYPLLLPLAQVAALEAADPTPTPDAWAYRSLYALFYPAFLLVLHDGARRRAGARAAALVTLAAASLPFLSFQLDGGALGGYSDLPLACFYGAGLLLLLEARPNLSKGLAAGLLLAAAVLTKNEGTILAAVALLAAAVFTWRRRLPARAKSPRLLPLTLAALLALAAFALLASWRSTIPNREDERYVRILHPGQAIVQAATRIPSVAPLLLRRMADWHDWNLFWYLVPAVLLAGRRSLRHSPWLPLTAAALAPPAIGWGAYAVHWDPLYLAGVTWNRLLVQASLPLLLLLALALRDLTRGAGLTGQAHQPTTDSIF